MPLEMGMSSLDPCDERPASQAASKSPPWAPMPIGGRMRRREEGEVVSASE